MGQWEPPAIVLTESDLREIDERAAASFREIRTREEEAHAGRVKALKDTLAKIREQGAARLQAQKDAAAVSAVSGVFRLLYSYVDGYVLCLDTAPPFELRVEIRREVLL